MIPGEVLVADGEIELNVGRKTVRLAVDNTGDRPVQVGSHYHFFETNPALAFDRSAAYGFRLDIAAGTAVRFEPGQRRTIDLVELSGKRTVFGLRAAVSGKLKSVAPVVSAAPVAAAKVGNPKAAGKVASTKPPTKTSGKPPARKPSTPSAAAPVAVTAATSAPKSSRRATRKQGA